MGRWLIPAWLVLAAACSARPIDDPFANAPAPDSSTPEGGDGSADSPAEDASSASDASDAQENPCTMTLEGAVTATGPCAIDLRVHGPHGYDPAMFRVELVASSSPKASFALDDFSAGYLQPPSSAKETATGIAFDGSVEQGSATWRTSGDSRLDPPSPRVGSFTLSIEPGPPQGQKFPNLHGTLDVVLHGPNGTVAMHVVF